MKSREPMNAHPASLDIDDTMNDTQANPRKILVVGSAVNILDALPKDLFGADVSFRVQMVNGISAATLALQRERFDILILSPGDGESWTTFFGAMRVEHPHMARVVLAERGERERQVDALWATHYFLPRACDRRTLRSALHRVADLQLFLRSAGVESVLGRLDRLPSVNRVFSRLICEANRPDVAPSDLARIVETDVSLSARVLQIVNSSYFGLGMRIASIHQAVSYLGVTMMRSVAMAAQLQTLFDTTPIALAAATESQRHGLITGRLAAHLVEKRADADLALSAGLLHDIGKLALLCAVRSRMTPARSTSHAAADDVADVSHAALGGFLAHVWGLPDEICEIISFHHKPHRAGHSEITALTYVHVADAIVASELGGAPLELDMPYLTRIRATSRLDEWTETARAFLDPSSGRKPAAIRG